MWILSTKRTNLIRLECRIIYVPEFLENDTTRITGGNSWVVNLTVNKCCSVAQSCPTLCDPMDCSTPGFLSFTISWILLKLMSIESVMSSNHIILCHPLLLLSSIFPSIRIFSHELAIHIRWSNYWSFSFSISPSNEYLGLISFSIDWFDLAVQGTLKNLLPHHSSKASIQRRHSAFFMVQLSHPYMTTGKTIYRSLLAK